MNRLLSPVLCLLLIAGLAFGGGCSDDASGTSSVRVDDFRYVKLPDGNREFTGTVVNSGGTRYAVVQIEVTLYGPDGSRAGIQKIEVDDVPPRSETPFRTEVRADATIERARVRSVLVP